MPVAQCLPTCALLLRYTNQWNEIPLRSSGPLSRLLQSSPLPTLHRPLGPHYHHTPRLLPVLDGILGPLGSPNRRPRCQRPPSQRCEVKRIAPHLHDLRV